MSKFSLLKDVYDIEKDLKEPHIIRIFPFSKYQREGLKAEVVEGFMKNEVSFDFNADWKPGSDKSILSFLTTMAKPFEDYSRIFHGTAISDAGFITRKVYSGGTDLSLKADFRIIDDEANGKTTKMVRTLMSYMVPLETADISLRGGQEFMSDVSKVLDINEPQNVDSSSEGQEQPQQSIIGGSIRNTAGELVKLTGKMGGFRLSELKEYGLSATQAPTPVTVKIGNFLYLEDAVITSANMTCSQQKTSEGPLFVDISLNISTRENIVLTKRKDSEGYALRGVGIGNQDAETTHKRIPLEEPKQKQVNKKQVNRSNNDDWRSREAQKRRQPPSSQYGRQ